MAQSRRWRSTRRSGSVERAVLPRRHWNDRRPWLVGRICVLVRIAFLNALEIGMGVVADTDAIADRPVETGRQQDIRPSELLAHQISAAVVERDLHVPQL